MLLRVFLSAALILNSVAEAVAAGNARVQPYATAFTAKNGASTRLTQTDAQDWIIEAVAVRELGDSARSRQLLEAARERLILDKIPEPYSAEIHRRMNDLVVQVGGKATQHIPKKEVRPPRLENEPCTPGGFGTLDDDKSGGQFGDKKDNSRANSGNTSPANRASTPSKPPCDIRNLAEGLSLDELETIPEEVENPHGRLLISSPRLKITDLVRATQNAEVRALLWWIASGRMAFYSKDENLAEIIRRKVRPEDQEQLDSFRNNFGMGGYSGGDVDPGLIGNILSVVGIYNKDYNAEAQALIQLFDGSKLSEMADRYVKDAVKFGALYGLAFGIWPGAKKAGITSGGAGGAGGRWGGGMGGSAVEGTSRVRILADSTSSFLNNADFMLKIGALYGVKIDGLHKQLLGLLLLSMTKGSARWRSRAVISRNDAIRAADSMRGTFRALGNRIGRAIRKKDLTAFLSKELDSTLTSGFNAPVPGVPVVVGPNGPLQPPKDPNAPPANGGAQKRAARKLNMAQRIALFATTAVRAGTGASIGAGEAYVVARASKHVFEGMYEDNVRLQNKSFIRVLNSRKGFAFLKILIQSMHLEEDSISPVNLSKPTRETQFILNLARTAGICSDSDFQRLHEAQVKKQELTQELRRLRFSCPFTKDSRAYDLLHRELVTFNAVKSKNLVRLRASILRDRIKMAQLLIQFQFIDGFQSQEEQEFFEEVTSKILGITSEEQKHYLTIFEGYINQAGKMQPSAFSPTGFAIYDRQGRDPYDLRSSPTPVNAPSQILAIDWGDPSPGDDSTNGGWNNNRFNGFTN